MGRIFAEKVAKCDKGILLQSIFKDDKICGRLLRSEKIVTKEGYLKEKGAQKCNEFGWFAPLNLPLNHNFSPN